MVNRGRITNQANIQGTVSVPESARLRVVVFTVALSLAWVVMCAGRSWSSGNTAALLGLVNFAILSGWAVWKRDARLLRLLFFGAVVGVVELLADALCVRFTHTLDYTLARSAMVGLSPWWMPLAWTVVACQIGYLGARLMDWLGPMRGAICAALLGAVNIPFYEEMAYWTHWWQYRDCVRIGHTPVYIIAAEFVIGLAFAPLSHETLKQNTNRAALLCGIGGGLATIAGGLIGYGLVERILPYVLGTRTTLLP